MKVPFVGQRNDVPQAEEQQPEHQAEERQPKHRCFEDLNKRITSLLLTNEKARLGIHDVTHFSLFDLAICSSLAGYVRW